MRIPTSGGNSENNLNISEDISGGAEGSMAAGTAAPASEGKSQDTSNSNSADISDTGADSGSTNQSSETIKTEIITQENNTASAGTDTQVSVAASDDETVQIESNNTAALADGEYSVTLDFDCYESAKKPSYDQYFLVDKAKVGVSTDTGTAEKEYSLKLPVDYKKKINLTYTKLFGYSYTKYVSDTVADADISVQDGFINKAITASGLYAIDDTTSAFSYIYDIDLNNLEDEIYIYFSYRGSFERLSLTLRNIGEEVEIELAYPDISKISEETSGGSGDSTSSETAGDNTAVSASEEDSQNDVIDSSTVISDAEESVIIREAAYEGEEAVKYPYMGIMFGYGKQDKDAEVVSGLHTDDPDNYPNGYVVAGEELVVQLHPAEEQSEETYPEDKEPEESVRQGQPEGFKSEEDSGEGRREEGQQEICEEV